jgi:hypothetical protein
MFKLIGQIIGLILGSCISPCWAFLNQALSNYFNLQKALLGPAYLVAEVQHFRIVTEAYPHEILFQLVPILIFILFCSGLFVASVSHLFGFVLDSLAQKAGLKPNTVKHSPWTLHLRRY